MNLSLAESGQLADDLVKFGQVLVRSETTVVLCPTHVALTLVAEKLKNCGMVNWQLGAQDIFWHEKGAYTGEVSGGELKEASCRYVLIGHSERREYLGETDEMINRKISVALKTGLTPVVCIGETLDERREGRADLVIMTQLAKALQDIELTGQQQLLVAYEPIWVIGSGQAIGRAEAVHTAQVIRQALKDIFERHQSALERIQVIYGGSVESGNVSDFYEADVLVGVLVGGASLNAQKFISIVKNY